MSAILLTLFALISPIQFRNFVFLPMREIGFFVVQLRPFGSTGSVAKRILTEPNRMVVAKSHPDDIEIVADLYRPGHASPAPGVLLLHGSSVHGRRSGLIRLLGTEFQSRGWYALAPDTRGFGETDDPANIESAGEWRVRHDIDRALQVLVDSGASADQIYVFGHSLGVDHALEGALNNPQVRKIALASPGIYLDYSIGWWQLVRFSADRRLEHVLPANVVADIRRPGSLNGFADGALRLPRLQPILLVYGLADSASVVADYIRISSNIAEPFELRGIANAGHWFGIRSFFGSDTIYYREDVFAEFFGVLTEFFKLGSRNQSTLGPDTEYQPVPGD